MTLEELAKVAEWHEKQDAHRKRQGFTGEIFERHTAAAATIRAAIEALSVADAALRGCNMNMNVVERKVTAALGKTPPKRRRAA